MTERKINFKKRLIAFLTVFIISFVLFSFPVSAYNGTIISNNMQAVISGTVQNSNGVVSAIFFTTSQSAYYCFDLQILANYTNINSYNSDFNIFTGQASATDTRYTTRLESYFNSLDNSLSDGFQQGVNSGLNSAMESIIDNANQNGLNLSYVLWSDSNLENVLDDIREKSESDGIVIGANDFEQNALNSLHSELNTLDGIFEPVNNEFSATLSASLGASKNVWEGNAEELGYNNGYSEGYNDGASESVAQAFQDGYNKGYTQAGTDLDGFNESLITIFSSPYYIFNEVFDFEIFGVSLASVLMFILSVLLVGFVIKLII